MASSLRARTCEHPHVYVHRTKGSDRAVGLWLGHVRYPNHTHDLVTHGDAHRRLPLQLRCNMGQVSRLQVR